MNNPFSLTFGKTPENLIGRTQQIDSVLGSFQGDNPDFQICLLTGLRGVGKTVCLTTIANELRKDEDWLVVDLSPERNLIDCLTAELIEHQGLSNLVKDTKINISAFGLGLEFGGGSSRIRDNAVYLDRILAKLTENNKRVLITVDEVLSNRNVREFISQFQIYLRKNYNIFLLMTGLYENIYDLQNAKTMTFLYRAPKLVLGPLNILLIEESYKRIFNLSDVDAHAMADMTKGYPYAFQLLGYFCYKEKKKYDEVIVEYDAYLGEYVYDKIWSELSSTDRLVLNAMVKANDEKVGSIRKAAGMESGTFSVYRQRLLKKGLIIAPEYGCLDFVLPRFREYILRQEEEYL